MNVPSPRPPADRRPRLPRAVRARIIGAFALLVAGVGVTAGLSLRTHAEVHRLLEDVARAERGIQFALELSAEVRDFYAHQAHTLILNDRSHLGYYDEARAGVERALAATRKHDPAPEDGPLLDEVAALAAELDRNFVAGILPGIGGAREALLEPHDRTLAIADGIVDRVNVLTDRLRERAEAARARARAAERAASGRTVGFLLLAIGFSIGAGIFVHRSIHRPLRTLAEGVDRVAGGDLETRLHTGRRDEFGWLAERFNEMAAELARRQERLVRSEKLAGIGRLAAGVAHEIFNPLAAILGYARLIARGTDERSRADAAVIVKEVERCQQIVAGLLDLSRPPRLALRDVDLAELAEETFARIRDVLGTGRLELRSAGPVVAEADAGKVAQILGNLLRNAIEAAPEEAVEIAVERRGDRAVVRVRDRGPGVDPAARSRLFEPFFTTKPKGTGLGLAVSASLAEAHGGSLTLVDDGSPGACLELALPIAAAEVRSA